MDEAYVRLAHAIVHQAITDYMVAVRDNDEDTMLECEKFFKSELYEICTPVLDEHLAEHLKQKVRDFLIGADYSFRYKPVSKRNPKDKRYFREDNAVFKCPICGGGVIMYQERYKVTKGAHKGRSIKGLVCRCQSCLFFVRDYKLEVTEDA